MHFFDELKEHLDKNILENDYAKESILDAFVYTTQGKDGNLAQNIPRVFLIAGGSSSGKSHTASTIASFFASKKYETLSFNMGAYKGYNSGGDIHGSEATFGNSSPGKLTSHLLKHENSCIILENFDKAHHNVQEVFIQAFEKGTIKDLYGFIKERGFNDKALTSDNYTEHLDNENILFEVTCKETIFILTTSEGGSFYNNTKLVEEVKQKNRTALESFFTAVLEQKNSNPDRSETVGFSEMIASILRTAYFLPVFPLSFVATTSLLESHIRMRKSILNCKISIKDVHTITQALILSCGPIFDIRKIINISQLNLFDPILDVLRHKDSTYSKINIRMDTASQKFVKEVIETIGAENIFKVMFRKNLYLKMSSIQTNDGSSDFGLILSVEPKLQKSIKASDYTGNSGGLIVEVPDITFDDIAGHKHVKTKLKEITTYLKNPQLLEAFDIPLSKGMILYGPPGTGKTMLAKAFAHEADLPFIATTGTDMLSLEKMHAIFSRAIQYAPSIIFIDEIDTIGIRDSSGKEHIINQFLTHVDGFSQTKDDHVFIIAATNFKEKLDPAIVRSGRLDLHVEIPILDAEARTYFIKKILQKPTVGTFDTEKLVMFTAGMSGADLEKMAREASLEAIRKEKKGITQEILIEQINILKYGERICTIALEKTLKATAYHEAGHAVISKVLIPELKIEQIVVSPRNDALGFVAYNFEQDFSNFTYEDIKNRICVAYAGRLAQMEKFGDKGLDSGAHSDLATATALACYAVGSLGMDETLGYVDVHAAQKTFGTRMFENVLEERIGVLLDEQKSKALSLVKKHWSEIENVAKALIKEEFLDEKEFYAIVKKP